ncbi:MAG TPA: primosomal protein N' [Rickettsiales bacterium]|nr:primosomal protein N' [Rickettsiales bacterium]
MNRENEIEIIAAESKAGVLLPLVFSTPFDYRVPEGVSVQPGDYVRVPFGKKSVWGVVWGKAEGDVSDAKVKTIETLAAHMPPMSEEMRKLVDWVAWYTLAPKGQVLKMALSVPEALEMAQEPKWQLSEIAKEIKLTPARQRILAYLADNVARTAKEITLHAKVSSAVLREFIKLGGLIEASSGGARARGGALATTPASAEGVSVSEGGVSPLHDTNITPSTLSSEQSTAALNLREKLLKGFSVSLLDGVTGSGKTEVYFDTIAEVIRQGKQALVLLPEIALSVQWLARFEKRFGFAPALWHSSVTPAQKRKTWRGIAEGSVPVVVGARSALFLPFRNLALIVADEEHDPSYKQEEGVIYQARDMAVVRARLEKVPLLLVSATPSLETEFNLRHNRYERIHLPNRHNQASMPEVQLVDMRRESLPKDRWISEPLKQALVETLGDGHQALVFMNRRGYAPLVLCRSCGHRFQCPHCTAWLVLHRSRGKLMCHHCGHTSPVPKLCPDCKAENSLLPYGPGVERIAEELRDLFPKAKVGLMTSDGAAINSKEQAAQSVEGNAEEPQATTPQSEGVSVSEGGDLRSPPSDVIHQMINREIDILVGTQMLAKGHHFAGLALVGVVDADMGLAGGDLRAGERTYQLLHQLAGRAGREKTSGTVILQTYMPEHPVMQALAAGERDNFMLLEAQMREDAEMPPYGKLAALIVEGPQEQEVAGFARELVKVASGYSMAETRSIEGTRKSEAMTSQGSHGGAGTGAACPPYTSAPLQQPLILGPAPAPLARLKNRYRYRILIKAQKNFPMQQWLNGWLATHKVPSSLRLKVDIEPYSFV